MRSPRHWRLLESSCRSRCATRGHLREGTLGGRAECRTVGLDGRDAGTPDIELVAEPAELREMIECIAAVFSACTSDPHGSATELVRGYFEFDPPPTHRLLAIAAREQYECVGVIIGF